MLTRRQLVIDRRLPVLAARGRKDIGHASGAATNGPGDVLLSSEHTQGARARMLQ
jgi:hypothetical protein